MGLKKLGVLGMLLLMAFCGACTQVNPLAVSGSGSWAGGPCSNGDGPKITAIISRLSHLMSGTVTASTLNCVVHSSDCAGSITMTGATLNLPGGGSVVLTMNGSDSSTFSDDGTGWTYVSGQVYTVNVIVGGVTYSSAITLKGGSAVIPRFASGGGPITWTDPGDYDSVQIMPLGGGTVLEFRPVLPGAISTADPSLYPGPGTYRTYVRILQEIDVGAFGPGASYGSFIAAEDEYWSDDSK